MRILLFAVLFVTATAAGPSGNYPGLQINRVDRVHFGQSMAEVERMLEQRVRPADPDETSRPGIDFTMTTGSVQLDFDTGKLDRITLDYAFNFSTPLTVYAVSWRNFDAIGGLHLTKGMTKADFAKYLAAWEKRAQAQGAVRSANHDGVLRDGEYDIDSTAVEPLFDMILISFGPGRAIGANNSSHDIISVSFVTAGMAPVDRRKAGTLDSITFFCDEFNTRSRHPSDSSKH